MTTLEELAKQKNEETLQNGVVATQDNPTELVQTPTEEKSSSSDADVQVTPKDIWEKIGAQPVDEIIEWLKSLVFGEPGCIAGSTHIAINRAGKSFSLSIEDIHSRLAGIAPPAGRSWRKDIPTTVRASFPDGTIRLAELKQAIYSGEKETYALSVDQLRGIRATEDHLFLTPEGWKRVNELVIGDWIGIAGRKINFGDWKSKPLYKVRTAIWSHPLARSRGRVAEHRLIFEAFLNNLPLEEFISRVKPKNANISGLIFLDETDQIHHINEDPLDNRLSNLERFKSNTDHILHHLNEGGWKNVIAKTEFVPLRQKVLFGEEKTYDLVIADDPHNFIANGIVCHNSGKTYLGGTAGYSELTSPGLIIDIDGGVTTVRNFPNLKAVQVRSLAGLSKMFADIHSAIDWTDPLHPKLPFKFLMLDSITELQKIDMQEIMAGTKAVIEGRQDKYVPSEREWFISQGHMREIIRKFKDLPCHVLFTAHLDPKKNSKNQMVNGPDLPGKLRNQISGFFDVCGLLYTAQEGDEVVRKIQFAKTDTTLAKDRLGVLGQVVVNPTFPMLVEKLLNSEVVAA